MTMREKAIEIAEAAHKGQLRKDGKTPYITHPAAVAEILKDHGYPLAVQCAGLLHDVIEDGSPNRNWMNVILDEMGEGVFSLVMWVTALKGPGTRKARKVWTRQMLRNAPYDAQAIKLADILANVRDSATIPDDFRPVWLSEAGLLLNEIQYGDTDLAHDVSDAIKAAQRSA